MIKFPLFFVALLMVLNGFAQGELTSYSGTIKGYRKEMGFSTGTLLIQNPVSGLNESVLINISEDGRFSVDFPLLRQQECWVYFPFSGAFVYLEPGAKLIQDFDVSDAPKVTSVFRGDGAAINQDLQKVMPILMESTSNSINKPLTPAQYKNDCLMQENQKRVAIDSIQRVGGLHPEAYRRALLAIQLNTAHTLMEYNNVMESAYRRENQLSFQNRTPMRQASPLPAAYYDFLSKLRYGDPRNIESAFYQAFLNKLKNVDLIADEAKAIWEKAGSPLQHAIRELEKQPTRSEQDSITLHLYRTVQASEQLKMGEKMRPQILRAVTGSDLMLELELMRLQDTCLKMDYNQRPLDEATLQALKLTLKYPVLMDDVVRLNQQIKAKMAFSGQANGSVKRQVPQGTADSLLFYMLQPYKGKVVFMDFWATWCAPCLKAMKDMEPMKAELMAKGVVFLYVTNQSSPSEAYNVMMPTIKGEHYKLDADADNRLSTYFGRNGFPHYALINKQGEVVNKDFKWNDVEDVRKALTSLQTANGE